MELLVALAVAGAGYVAKHWKINNKEKENSSDSTPKSSNVTGPHIDKSYPFRRLAQILISEEGNGSQIDSYEDAGSISSKDLENDLNPVISEELSNDIGQNFEILYDSKKNKSSLKSRRSNLRIIKPLTSLDSCLFAQLYNEHSEIDEFVSSCFPSSFSPFVRPFTVTDGRRIIGREGANTLNLHNGVRKNNIRKQMSLLDNEIVYGVPTLHYNINLEVSTRRSAKAMGLGVNLSSSVTRGKHYISLGGSTSGALLFGFGVSVGLIFSLLANKKEVDKLNGLLKQAENLVQDLQDELEMKDSITVKELPVEELKSEDSNYEFCGRRALQSFSSERNMDGLIIENGENVPGQKRDEDFESMSEIEAELEAELQRLELNMNSSSLERRLFDLIESDPDFVSGISQGELRSDMFGVKSGDQPYADQDGSGNSTCHPHNYSVPHEELTLRLHEVIQTRLEEHIKELETALEISERKVRAMESKDHSDSNSISSPIAIDEPNLMDQPVIINLFGEALDAYNEAYDELEKEKDKDLNVCEDGNVLSKGESMLDWQISSGDIGCSGTESENDDELEKLLIKQIVEKNRRNSSAILDVERELFKDKDGQ